MSHQVRFSQVHWVSYCKTPTKTTLVTFFGLPYCHCDKICARKGSKLPVTVKVFKFKASLQKNQSNLAFITSKTQHKKELVLVLTWSAYPRALLKAGPWFLLQVFYI